MEFFCNFFEKKSRVPWLFKTLFCNLLFFLTFRAGVGFNYTMPYSLSPELQIMAIVEEVVNRDEIWLGIDREITDLLEKAGPQKNGEKLIWDQEWKGTGRTVFHVLIDTCSAHNCVDQLVEFVARLGASLNVTDNNGITPMMSIGSWSQYGDGFEFSSDLLDRFATFMDMQAVKNYKDDVHGKTLVHFLAGSPGCFKFLEYVVSKYDFPTSERDNLGKLPIDYARAFVVPRKDDGTLARLKRWTIEFLEDCQV